MVTCDNIPPKIVGAAIFTPDRWPQILKICLKLSGLQFSHPTDCLMLPFNAVYRNAPRHGLQIPKSTKGQKLKVYFSSAIFTPGRREALAKKPQTARGRIDDFSNPPSRTLPGMGYKFQNQQKAKN